MMDKDRKALEAYKNLEFAEKILIENKLALFSEIKKELEENPIYCEGFKLYIFRDKTHGVYFHAQRKNGETVFIGKSPKNFEERIKKFLERYQRRSESSITEE